MDVKGKGFVIKDKRALDEKGDLREEQPEEKVEKKEEKKEEVKKEDFDRAPLPEVNFNSLIFSLSSSTLLNLGEIADPQTGEKKQDLVLAKHSIDVIAMLKAIDLPREDVYITNIVKCYRPDKRDHLSEEIKTCHAYLRRQIELIQPKVIYAAGAMASQALLHSEESISLLRKRQHHYEGIPLIASFHPAYLLRKPSEKRKAWEDLQQVKKLLDE